MRLGVHMNSKTKELLSAYAGHPDFLGLELVDINQRGAVDDAPIHVAVRSKSIEHILELIRWGADIGMKGDMGNTPLHFSAMVGRSDVVVALLRAGANPHLRNEFDQTPRKMASLGGHVDAEKILLDAEVSFLK